MPAQDGEQGDDRGPGGPHGGDFRGGPHGQAKTMDWSRFFSSMVESTARAALPRGGPSMGGPWAAGGGGSETPSFGTVPSDEASLAGSSSQVMSQSMSQGMSSGGGFSGGGQGGGMGAGGGMGRVSMFSLGDNVMRSLASSTGGALGESFSMLSRGSSLSGPGMATSMKAGGLNLNLSGSLQGLWNSGGAGQGLSQAQGQGGQSLFGGGQSGGGPGGGPGGGGHGGGGPGVGLALHMKF